METFIIVLGVLGCFFGLVGFLASAVTAVIVLGWRNSTHKIIQVPDTKYEYDVPKDLIDAEETMAAYLKRKQAEEATNLDSLYATDDQ